MFYLAVSFGELDVSLVTIGIMIVLSIFTFIAVGLSSLNLVQSLFKDDEDV